MPLSTVSEEMSDSSTLWEELPWWRTHRWLSYRTHQMKLSDPGQRPKPKTKKRIARGQRQTCCKNSEQIHSGKLEAHWSQEFCCRLPRIGDHVCWTHLPCCKEGSHWALSTSLTRDGDSVYSWRGIEALHTAKDYALWSRSVTKMGPLWLSTCSFKEWGCTGEDSNIDPKDQTQLSADESRAYPRQLPGAGEGKSWEQNVLSTVY
jgi:hypothetical protein